MILSAASPSRQVKLLDVREWCTVWGFNNDTSTV
jgi:hypothetical protein